MASRRKFIQSIGGASLASMLLPTFDPMRLESILATNKDFENYTPEELANEEDFWLEVQRAYTVSPNVINLNNGGVSPQPLLVQQAQYRYTQQSNEGPAYYMWRVVDKGRLTVKRKLAEMAGCTPEEIAIQRNATESLENLLFGFDLNEGEEVLTTKQDYPSMLHALRQREEREGIVVKQISVPVPLDDEDVLVKRFEENITPNTKMILACHMINLTGQVLPIRKICDLGRKHNIPVIVDGAHTFAHFDFTMDDLGCDYFATSLHKWLCAPFGTGMLYIKKDKIEDVWPLHAPPEGQEAEIGKFEHLGTRSFPAEMAIGHAINFHNGIGTKRKEARLRYLTDYWVEKVKDIPKVSFNTSFAKNHYGAISNFAIEGMEPGEIHRTLFNEYNIYTVAINHEEVNGVRVSPHIYTTLNDLETLVGAIKNMAT